MRRCGFSRIIFHPSHNIFCFILRRARATHRRRRLYYILSAAGLLARAAWQWRIESLTLTLVSLLCFSIDIRYASRDNNLYILLYFFFSFFICWGLEKQPLLYIINYYLKKESLLYFKEKNLISRRCVPLCAVSIIAFSLSFDLHFCTRT